MFDEATIEQARNADIIIFLGKRYGFAFAQQGGTFRCKQHPSLAVKNDRRNWYWHSKGIGGSSSLDFLIIAECMPFREAVKTLTGVTQAVALPRRETEQPKTLILPEKAGIPLRLYDYLCVKRGISRNIVDKLLQEGKIYEDIRGNVVFLGYDENNKPRFASVRGTYSGKGFRQDCAGSDKRYGFSMEHTRFKRLYLYESPIDAMSHGSLINAAMGYKDAWRQQNRLSLAGTSDIALVKHLETRPYIEELVFCLDNDPPGREATEYLMKKYANKFKSTETVLPNGKDFNEDLISAVNNIRKENEKANNSRAAPCI